MVSSGLSIEITIFWPFVPVSLAEVQDKLLRAGGFAVEGAKRAAPLLSLPWALGVRAMVPWWQGGMVTMVPPCSIQWGYGDIGVLKGFL